MEYRFLSECTDTELYVTFLEAFSDYAIDMSYMNGESYMNRSYKNGLDRGVSVAVFDEGRMVGFTLIGVDLWKNEFTAFDIGTGIIKEYRNRGIAKEMFKFAIPKLKEKGIQKFVLEVIQDNEPAIKAYKKTGFEIVREFDCFELKLDNAHIKEFSGEELTIKPIKKDQLLKYESYLDWQPSWENSFASTKRIPDDVMLLVAKYESQDAGILVYYPALNWIMCLAVNRSFRRKGVASFLLKNIVEKIKNNVSIVKLINVQNTDEAMTSFLKQTGFEVYVKQFEMEFDLGK